MKYGNNECISQNYKKWTNVSRVYEEDRSIRSVEQQTIWWSLFTANVFTVQSLTFEILIVITHCWKKNLFCLIYLSDQYLEKHTMAVQLMEPS